MKLFNKLSKNKKKRKVNKSSIKYFIENILKQAKPNRIPALYKQSHPSNNNK